MRFWDCLYNLANLGLIYIQSFRHFFSTWSHYLWAADRVMGYLTLMEIVSRPIKISASPRYSYNLSQFRLTRVISRQCLTGWDLGNISEDNAYVRRRKLLVFLWPIGCLYVFEVFVIFVQGVLYQLLGLGWLPESFLMILYVGLLITTTQICFLLSEYPS